MGAPPVEAPTRLGGSGRSEPADVPRSLRVVLVHYRTRELCLRALRSVARERKDFPELRATVVENASGDGSAAFLSSAIAEERWGSWVDLLESPTNVGFGAGCNLALEQDLASDLPADAYLLLNPDAELGPGSLRPLVDCLGRRPGAGFVGPLTEIGRGHPRTTAFRFPGILSAFDEGLHLGLVSRLLAPWVLSPPLRETEHETDWLSGGCLLVRRRVLEETGLFDPAYFLYFEETELQWRARRKGWSAWFCPASRVLHDAGASTGCTGGRELERRVPEYWFASRRRYLRRTRGPWGQRLADLAWLLGNSLYQVRRLLGAPRREPPRFFSDFVAYNLLGRREASAAEPLPEVGRRAA